MEFALTEIVIHIVWAVLQLVLQMATARGSFSSGASSLPEPEVAQLRDARSEGEILSENRRRSGWTGPRAGRSVGGTSGGFVILESASVSAEARCPICAQEAHGEVRGCPSCGVVLHRDCMQYNGGCGIYGCGSSSSLS